MQNYLFYLLNRPASQSDDQVIWPGNFYWFPRAAIRPVSQPSQCTYAMQYVWTTVSAVIKAVCT